MDEARKQELLSHFSGPGVTRRKALILVEPYWEKQPRETIRQFDAFVLYRDMEAEKRSVVQVARLLRKSESHIQRWATVNKWAVRLEAHRIHKDRQDQEIEARLRRERRELQFQLAMGAANAGGARVQHRIEQLQAIEQNPALKENYDMTDKDAVSMMDFGVKLMRQLDGLPSEHILIETQEMRKERMLREAVADITELHRLDPLIGLDKRIKWASHDYQLDLNELTSAVYGYIDETENAEM